MELIPSVRMEAGLPPLVTPTSQIVGAQAVNCAIDEKAGRAMYTNKSSQFVSLVKGEYGTTPSPIDPEFRMKISGTHMETPYDTSKYKMQPNPELEAAGGVKLAETEKEILLLELFPIVAKNYLTNYKIAQYEANKPAEVIEEVKVEEPKVVAEPITGHVVTAPLPGKILSIDVKVGDNVTIGQEIFILEAMKMENAIESDFAGKVKRIFAVEGENVATNAPLVEFE